MPQLAYGGSVSGNGKLYYGYSLHPDSMCSSCERQAQAPPSLEEFVIRNDDHLYDRRIGLACLIDRAEVRLINQASSLEKLHSALKELNLPDEERLRPNWDQYFMQLASLAAQRSNCMKRRVGCVLVREKRVISTGYNGTPRNLKNCNDGGCEYYIQEYGNIFRSNTHRSTLQRRAQSRR